MFFFLLLSCLHTLAQQEQPDSTGQAIDTAPAEEITKDGTAAEEKKEKYFLEKQPFSESMDTLQLRKLPDSLVKTLQEDDDFWYANALLKKEKTKAGGGHIPLGQRNWFQTLLWLVIIGGFAGFLMWYLAGSNVGLFRRKSNIMGSEEEETVTGDIFAINYQKEIDKAAQQGNYRLAVRLMFLQLLKNLSEKNIIRYSQERTNMDYLIQLQPTRYYPDFFRITRNYEYSWYGHFTVNEEAYRIIKNDFTNFERQLR